MNGLRHHQIEDTPDVPREERIPILLSRLATIAAEVPRSELEKLPDDKECYICTEPFNSATEPVLRLPCQHLYCKTCLEQWITSWNRESALKVCAPCDDNCQLTAPSEEPQIRKPGFEPSSENRAFTAEELGPKLEAAVRDAANTPGAYGWDVERPWWMSLLLQVHREAIEETTASGNEPNDGAQPIE